MVFFSGSEIVEVAIQIERNGLSFYRSLASSMAQKDLKDLFNHLADEEEKHIESFQSFYESLKEYRPSIPDEEEYYDYVNMLAQMNVFTKKEGIGELLEKIKEKKGALDMAIGFEKDSILFFEEIKELVRGSHKKAVEELIRQEKGHLRRLFLMAIGREE